MAVGILHPLALGFVHGGFFWAGLLLIGIPIIIHILNRRRFKTVTWAAMHFLLAAMRKNRRRLRFEQMLLLAMRCLLLVMLGLVLARPLGCEQSALAALGRHSALNIIVINNSYSTAMSPDGPAGKTYLEQAKRLAEQILDAPSNAGSSYVVLTTARLPVTDSAAQAASERPNYDLQTLKDEIDRIPQTYAASDLLGALQRALTIGRTAADQNDKKLILITDATRSAWEGADSPSIKELGPQLAGIFKISHFSLSEGRTQWNSAMLGISQADPLITDKFQTSLKADARNFATHLATLQWRIDDQVLPDSASLQFDPATDPLSRNGVKFTTGGPHVVVATLTNSDGLGIDNSFYKVVDVASQLKTLIVEGKHGMSALEGSGAYLKIALAPQKTVDPGKPAQSDSYIVPENVSDLEFPDIALGDYRAVILTDVQQIAPAVADRIQKFVKQGGTLMVFMGDSIDPESYNAVMLPRGLMPGPLVKRVTASSDQKRGFAFDFHPGAVLNPLLHDFADQEDTGLDRVQVFTYWQASVASTSPAQRVLNYLPAEGTRPVPGMLPDPAITIQNNGLGRVVFFSTTASPEWTDLPARQNFLPLMQALLSGSVRAGDSWMNLQIGNSLAIPPTVKLASAPSLVDPAQRPIMLQPALDAASGNTIYRSGPLTRPGIYMLSTGDDNMPIAVNVPAAEEADVRTVTDDHLREDLGGVEMELHGPQLPAEASASEGSDWSWWCMAIVLVLAGLECFLAMRFGHHRPTDLSGMAGVSSGAGRGGSTSISGGSSASARRGGQGAGAMPATAYNT